MNAWFKRRLYRQRRTHTTRVNNIQFFIFAARDVLFGSKIIINVVALAFIALVGIAVTIEMGYG